MRILLLSQVVPYPPDSGPKIKTYSTLRYLAKRHAVHLICFSRTSADEANAQALRTLCRTVTTVPLLRSRTKDVRYLAQSLVTGAPFLVERDRSPRMAAAINALLSEHRFDAVHADQLSMAHFGVDLPVPLRVLDTHNAVWTIVRRAAQREAVGPRRLLAELEWRKLRAHEGRMCRSFDRVTVVSEADRQGLELAARARLPGESIPIAVDVEELAFRPPGPTARHILSVATMFYPPNVEGVSWFATHVLPLVRRRVPSALFYVVGSRPPEPIKRLAGSQRGIVVTGYVPDLEPLLVDSRLLVVPIHTGSGMRVKILEAFARGLPIVSTTVGYEGIDARPGEHLLVADDAAGFAAAVVRVLCEPDLAAKLARAGRELAVDRYDWRSALSGLDQIYGGA